MTPARARPRTTPSLHRLFRDGTFEVGERQLFDVVLEDYPTEYAAGEYLAIATLGQPIAVGTVHLPIPSRITLPYGGGTGDGWTLHELDLAVVPGRGVWQLEPVFDDWVEPVRRVARVREALAKLLGRVPRSLSMAYVPVLGREIAARRPDSVRYEDVYSPTLFLDPISYLRPSAAAEDADALITRILEVGNWIDTKANDHLDLIDTIPAWLAGLIPGYDGLD